MSTRVWKAARGSDEPAGQGRRKKATYVKQGALFTLTVLLPSLALVMLSLRMMWQDKELAENRSRERRAELGLRFGAALAKELEEVTASALNETSGGTNRTQAGMALVATVSRRDLVLPWERAGGGIELAGLVRGGPFQDHLSAGQRWEFAERQFAQALNSYREAVRHGQAPAQRAYAQLAAARVLSKIGRAEEAREGLDEVLNVPFSATDEANVPLGFYAAGQLLLLREPQAAASWLARSAEAAPAFPTAALYMLREYLDQFAALRSDRTPFLAMERERVSGIIQTREEWERVRDGLRPRVAPLAGEAGRGGGPDPKSRWVYDAAAPSFFRLAKVRGQDDLRAVLVHARRIAAAAVERGGFELFRGAPPELAEGPRADGVWLGEDFPNLQIILSAPAAALLATRPQSGLYAAVIALVAAMTLYGAYLWSRDTRRELKLAQMRSDFVASVSHELKTPLTSMQMLAETIRTRDLPARDRNEYLDLILGESQRLGRLLKNVLDFSQIEEGTRTYQRRPVALRTVLEASERAVRQPVREKNIVFVIENQAADAMVDADADALEQALLNLLYNALKYSDQGARIELSARCAGAEARIVVRDYGIGIHPRDHERIFERFYRAPEDHNRRIPGAGLGLALVRHIVESHGGRVTLESSPGAGSAFTICLPLRRAS